MIDETLHALDELIHARSILAHPFYLAWTRGELTREQLATYARVYYPHVAAFPGYLRNTLECVSDETTKRALEDNLEDELTKPAPHPQLWLDFAEGIGIGRGMMTAASWLGNTAETVSTFNRLTSSESISGLTALYSYESQQPAVAREKMRGLRRLYGVTDEKALAYFNVHSTTDLEHCAAERAALARCLRSGASVDKLWGATEESLRAYWSLLDGVMQEAAMECCRN
jgi:Pyrroloquinoline quinone (Coenzyme PQQ) biosynthesis protein C